MARTIATPSKPSNGTATKPANGTGNGAPGTNGNGSNGSRKATGYRQLRDGEKATWPGLTIERRFTRPDVHPYDTVEWEKREAAITNEHGTTVFEQQDIG